MAPTIEVRAAATASASTSTTIPIPSAYARNAAAAPSGPPPRSEPAVTARNGAIVHDSDASANEIPYPTCDHQLAAVGADPRPVGGGLKSCLPASSQAPSPTSSTPITTVTTGR